MNSSQPQKEPAVRISAESNLPNGPGAAAILSAGIGCFALSVFAVVADASKPVAKFFTFYLPTGSALRRHHDRNCSVAGDVGCAGALVASSNRRHRQN